MKSFFSVCFIAAGEASEHPQCRGQLQEHAQEMATVPSSTAKPAPANGIPEITHDVYELVSYVSQILTLKPGDIIATGSPAGVGAARNVFMKSGDTSVCTIGGVGTLTNPVR